jgi:hypothetical protein
MTQSRRNCSTQTGRRPPMHDYAADGAQQRQLQAKNIHTPSLHVLPPTHAPDPTTRTHNCNCCWLMFTSWS